jgi:APA family basic amino acid/polyamine antiporter
MPSNRPAADPPRTLVRGIGLFDATMIVMGGIIGAGIFRNPAVVAQRAEDTNAVLWAWLCGGLLALLGAFVFAELAAQRPRSGGGFVYLSEAVHPVVGFMYGWALLFVIQTAATAAVARTFAAYLLELFPLPLPETSIAVLTLVVLALVNIAGVRAGSKVQSALMVTKIAAIALICTAGATVGGTPAPPIDRSVAPLSFLAALVPVAFAYGGWQTVNFVAEEIRDPERTLPRALLFGVAGVVALYLAVNWVCLHVLGVSQLAASAAPAADVMRVSWGESGAQLVSIAVTLSTLGWLSQSMLTAPRVIYAMGQAVPKLRLLARLDPKTQVPSMAVILMAIISSAIAWWGDYGRILDYTIFADFFFFGLVSLTIFSYRKRQGAPSTSRIPGHPVTTVLFAVACFAISFAAASIDYRNARIGAGLVLLGGIIYVVLRARPLR